MRLKTQTADPSGNITLFVLDEVPVCRRAETAKAIMAKNSKVEQVAFRTGENRIEMAGGEFCGNASRAFGMLLAKERGITGAAEISIEISGADGAVSVWVNTVENTASAGMPQPRYAKTRTVENVTGTLVHLGGIAHFVVEGVEPSVEFFNRAEKLISEFSALEAYGVIFLEKNGSRMTPLVKVPDAGSLVWEGSCGSGSIACAVTRSIGVNGVYSEKYIQPAGEIIASVTRKNGEIVRASIGGTVSLGEIREIRINE